MLCYWCEVFIQCGEVKKRQPVSEFVTEMLGSSENEDSGLVLSLTVPYKLVNVVWTVETDAGVYGEME